ncbi:MAG: hypothetical protein RLZZ505_630 [Verrucomicrobiota bacterium]|jgi:hypothetical protein
MNRRTGIIVGLAMAFAASALLLLRPDPPENKKPPVPKRAPVPMVKPGDVATRPLEPRDLRQVPSHPLAVAFGADPELASSEPAKLLEILRFYRMEFGSFPAGQENADIMNSLTGNNPGKLPIFPRKHPRIDTAGRLLDAWGNPFVFHPVSSQQLEVRSLGPDGEIFSDDDLVAGKQPEPAR